MEYPIANLLKQDVETGKLNRRQILQALGVTGAAAFATIALPKNTLFAAGAAAEGKSFPVTTVNHLALGVADYARSRDWYVDLFNMRLVWDDGKQCAVEFGSKTAPNGLYIRPVTPGSGNSDKPGVGHIAFGVSDFMAKKAGMKAEMERRDLTNIRPDGEHGFIANDPAGYMLNPWVPLKDPAMYPGAGGTCDDASSAKCKDGFSAGAKNLSAAPKPSGKGFTALYYSYVVLNVPQAQLAKEREFYSGMYGMKVIYEKMDGPSPEVFLKFGQNTLYLRKTANPNDKPYCNQYAFAVENYDQVKVKAELERRGLKPQPDAKTGWIVKDPDGLSIGIAGS